MFLRRAFVRVIVTLWIRARNKRNDSLSLPFVCKLMRLAAFRDLPERRGGAILSSNTPFLGSTYKLAFLMRTESDKAPIELEVFARFIRSSGLPVEEGSIQKRFPPEPDILCELHPQGRVAFELAEACVPEFAQAISIAAHTGTQGVVWGSDTVEEIVRNKLQKSYPVAWPVELLIYTDSRVAPSDEVLLSKIRFALSGTLGQFRRVWLMGESVAVATPIES
jgi:hypothetical protein